MPLNSLTPTLSLASSIAILLLAIYVTYNPRSSSPPYHLVAEPEPSVQHTGYLDNECAGKPHNAGWGAWWHPQRKSQTPGQGAGTSTKDWNILYHLGGNGPWVEKVHNVVEGGIAVPASCRVEQVHMVGDPSMARELELRLISRFF